MDKQEYQIKPCYLGNCVVRELCKQRTACRTYSDTFFVDVPIITEKLDKYKLSAT